MWLSCAKRKRWQKETLARQMRLNTRRKEVGFTWWGDKWRWWEGKELICPDRALIDERTDTQKRKEEECAFVRWGCYLAYEGRRREVVVVVVWTSSSNQRHSVWTQSEREKMVTAAGESSSGWRRAATAAAAAADVPARGERVNVSSVRSTKTATDENEEEEATAAAAEVPATVAELLSSLHFSLSLLY